MSVPEVTAAPVRDGLWSPQSGALLASRCRACGALRFPASRVCANCQHTELEIVELSQQGTIYTFTIVRIAPPGYVGDSPYAVGIVELPERLRITATLTAADLEELEIGDAVELELVTIGSGDAEVGSFAFRRTGAQA